MSVAIRAHWHHFKQAALDGELYRMAKSGEIASHALETPYFSIDRFYNMMELCDNLPYFVIDKEIMDTVHENDVLATLVDMKRAGVFRLPFPTMMVELPSPWHRGGQQFVVLRDRQAVQPAPWAEVNTDGVRLDVCKFYGIHFVLTHDEEGPYAVFAPTTSYVDIVAGEGPGGPKLQVGAALSGVFDSSEQTPEKDAAMAQIMQDTYVKSGKWVGIALFCAALVLASRGLAKEVIETERLNKARKASGKVAVPRHIYIHIGRTYRAVGSNVSQTHVPRKSPRPHFVRGFTRGYHTGVKRTGPVVYKFHPAQWVAWHGDETEAEMKSIMATSMPEYDVRR